MESNSVHSLTLEQAVCMLLLPFWTISGSDYFVKRIQAHRNDAGISQQGHRSLWSDN